MTSPGETTNSVEDRARQRVLELMEQLASKGKIVDATSALEALVNGKDKPCRTQTKLTKADQQLSIAELKWLVEVCDGLLSAQNWRQLSFRQIARRTGVTHVTVIHRLRSIQATLGDSIIDVNTRTISDFGRSAHAWAKRVIKVYEQGPSRLALPPTTGN